MSEERKMPKHWYKIYIRECPICSKTEITRERQYGEKPEDPAKRYDYDATGGCYTHWI